MVTIVKTPSGGGGHSQDRLYAVSSGAMADGQLATTSRCLRRAAWKPNAAVIVISKHDISSRHEVIRLYPTDAPEYRNLMLEAYSLHPDAFTSSATERELLPLSWWEQRLSEGGYVNEVVFGCECNGQLAGVVGLAFENRAKTRHKATLFGMYVSAGFRSLGLGGELVNHALAYARARPGILLVQLTVSEGNRAAQAFYERNGFVQFGCEPCHRCRERLRFEDSHVALAVRGRLGCVETSGRYRLFACRSRTAALERPINSPWPGAGLELRCDNAFSSNLEKSSQELAGRVRQ